MATASTKSRNRKQANSHSPLPGRPPLTPTVAAVSERDWRVASALIFLLAAFLRFYHLNLVPLHHDEGVNGNFLVRLVRDGFYHYDPANYHGPTLYYFAAVFPWLLRLFFGPSAQNNYGLTTVGNQVGAGPVRSCNGGLIFTLRRNPGNIATLAQHCC